MKYPWLLLAAMLGLPAFSGAQIAIPPGTILPLSLDGSLKVWKAYPGKVIRATVMQNVPGTPIHRGAHVIGHVIRADVPQGGPARLEISFDAVEMHGRRIPLKADLRALASFFDVEQAQIPEEMSSRGLSPADWTTQQIGGETDYRGGGPVASGSTPVGKPTPYGVLALPRVQAGEPCRGVIGQNRRPQALWLFSTNACGLYGYSNIRLEHAGRSNPLGAIVLESRKGKLALTSGSGLLLRVQGS